MILHVCDQVEWREQLNESAFKPASFDTEGFVHCCLPSQLSGVLERYFKGKSDLLMLTIDEGLINANILYEEGGNGERFPHVYGAINKNAIVKIEKLPSGKNEKPLR